MELGIVGLLRTAWIASILPILLASVPCSRLNSFYEGLMVFAKRGKIMQSSSQVIYVGFVVASGGVDLTIWLLLGFVVSNLTFTAAETHRWCLRKFKDYPKNRCSIVPFIC